MSRRFIQKSWLSPFLAVSFLAVASTGIVLLFHGERLFLVMALHECMSVLLCLAGALHVWVNWKQLIGYLRQRKALVSLAVGVSLVPLLLALAEAHSSAHHADLVEAER